MKRGSRSAFITVVGSALAAATTPINAQALPSLRVGATTADGNMQASYALEQGMFARAGLSVDVQTFTSGSQTASALLGGSLDIGTTTPLPLANAAIRNVPFGMLCSGSVSTPKAPLLLLVTRKSGPIHAAKDLAGKTIGVVTVKTVMQLGVDMYLAKNNVPPSSVRFVEMAFPEMAPAIDRGTIDAAVMGEPFYSAALKNNDVRLLLDILSPIGPRVVSTVWFTTQEFGQRNPAAIRRFTNVIYESARWANSHRLESGKILAKYSKIDPNDIPGMLRADFAEATRTNEIQPLLDAAAKLNYLSRPVTVADLMLKA